MTLENLVCLFLMTADRNNPFIYRSMQFVKKRDILTSIDEEKLQFYVAK